MMALVFCARATFRVIFCLLMGESVLALGVYLKKNLNAVMFKEKSERT